MTRADEITRSIARGPSRAMQITQGLAQSGPDMDPQRAATNLERILNTLSIPNNAMAGGVQALIDGTDPLQGALEGIEQHTTFGKVLKGQGLSGPVAGTLGLGLDILLDPTTYLGIGGLTKAGRAARAATMGLKLARMTGEAGGVAKFGQEVARTGLLGASSRLQARAGQRALLSFAGNPIVPTQFSERVLGAVDDVAQSFGRSDFGQALNKMFASAERRAPEALRAFAGARRGASAALANRNIKQMLEPVQSDIARLASKAGVPYRVAATVVAEGVQRAEWPSELTKVLDQAKATLGATRLDNSLLRKAVNSINLANSYAIAVEKKAGLPISQLVGRIQYLKRAITPEGLQAIRKANPGFHGLGPREFATDYGAQMMRDPRLRDLTVSEINALGKAGELPFAKGIKIKEFFHEDPFVSTAYRLSESAQAVGTREFLEGAMRLYGAARAKAPSDWVGVTSTLTRSLEIPKDMVFPKAVAELLDSHYEKMISPQYLQGFLHNFDKLQGAWKSITLPIWPSYHVRNLISDAWMITAVPGGIPPQRVAQRGIEAGKVLAGAKGTIRLANRDLSYQELRQIAEQAGVLHVGVGRDIQELSKGDMLQRARDPLSLIQNNQFMRGAVMVGEARENLARLTYFIERLGRGDHPIHAAFETKLRLFDYGELSAFEKQAMRRIFPFYSWARNNIPFQIGHMMRRPGYGAAFQKTREEAGTAFGAEGPSQDAGPLPQFLARGLPVPVGRTKEDLPRFVRTQNILPVGDVSQVTSPQAFGQMMVDQLSPFPKAIGEMASNWDLFRNRPLERFPGESRPYLGVNVPGRLSPAVDLLRPVAELQRLNPGNLFGQSPMSGGERAANFMVGRTYQVDPTEQAQREQAALRGVVQQLQYARKLALSRGDTANAQAAERALLQVLEHPEQALGMRR